MLIWNPSFSDNIFSTILILTYFKCFLISIEPRTLELAKVATIFFWLNFEIPASFSNISLANSSASNVPRGAPYLTKFLWLSSNIVMI